MIFHLADRQTAQPADRDEIDGLERDADSDTSISYSSVEELSKLWEKSGCDSERPAAPVCASISTGEQTLKEKKDQDCWTRIHVNGPLSAPRVRICWTCCKVRDTWTSCSTTCTKERTIRL